MEGGFEVACWGGLAGGGGLEGGEDWRARW